MAETGVTNTFLPPTAIKMMRAVERAARAPCDLRLRTVGSAGERLGARLPIEWGKEALGLAINEFYGQTECNYVLGASAALGVVAGRRHRQGGARAHGGGDRCRGRALPHGAGGRDRGTAARPGDVPRLPRPAGGDRGEIHRRLDADRRQGDGGRGRLRPLRRPRRRHHHLGAATASGRARSRTASPRTRPCSSPRRSASPTALRTEIVKAYVALRPGHAPTDALAAEIRAFVRERLSAAEYPREIAFVDEVPLTTSGKVIRRGFREQAAREAGAVDEGQL